MRPEANPTLSASLPPAAEPVAIRYERVSFSYGGRAEGTAAARAVLSDVTLDVRHGERLGILGPNGGGKTTLIKLTLGLLKGCSGRVEVFGQPPEVARRRGLIGYVPQRNEAELAFPLSARQVVGLGASRGVPDWKPLTAAARAAIEDSIELVGATDFADRPIGKLSGGQVQRALIARALASRPRILVLDEPTVGVDAVGQQRFAELLRTIHTRLDLTLLIVSHDIRTIAAACDRVACLSRTLHYHDAPRGLTPAVLAEVFRHDVAAVFGDVHVDAHRAAECAAAGHTHPHH